MGNTTKETKMNQLLEEMGAVEMTGEEVVHRGNYYAYSISDVAKDFCQGAAMKKSYVGYLPIWVGGNDSDESHEKFVISIDTYAPNSYAQVFDDNELEE